jgi:Matrixin
MQNLMKERAGRQGRRLAGAVAATLVMVAVGLVDSGPAEAHFSGADSVDGSEIRWEDHTVFDDARVHSINTWNALGRIKILPDGRFTITDLKFKDFNFSNAGWDGIWTANPGADTIGYNRFYFDGYNDTQRRGVAAHEMGHALGLAHSFPGELMVDNTPQRGSITTPQSHDIADYHALWG